jgi:hypothetical protein
VARTKLKLYIPPQAELGQLFSQAWPESGHALAIARINSTGATLWLECTRKKSQEAAEELPVLTLKVSYTWPSGYRQSLTLTLPRAVMEIRFFPWGHSGTVRLEADGFTEANGEHLVVVVEFTSARDQVDSFLCTWGSLFGTRQMGEGSQLS